MSIGNRRDPGSALAPRLVLAKTRARRAVLDGGWWPRSWGAAVELPGLVLALSERYGRVRHVLLNRDAWEGHVRRLAVGGEICRVGWFTSMSAALVIAITDGGDQFDLLVVPPSSSKAVAERAMAAAADSANMMHAADLLAACTDQAASISPVAAIAGIDDGAEAVWDNEGGGGRSPFGELPRPARRLTPHAGPC